MTVSKARNVAEAGGAILVAALVFSATAGTVLASSMPGVAELFAPYGALAKANEAVTLLPDQKAAGLDRVASLASSALQRQPYSARAAMALGSVADQRAEPAKALRLFTYSEMLSRREPLSQLWLIEHSVSQGDVAGALVHYHRALSTNSKTGTVLLPVLVAASADDNVAKPLVRMLRERPIWWRSFLEQLVTSGTSAATIGRVARALNLNVRVDYERDLFAVSLNRMMQLGAYRAAYAAYIAKVPTADAGLIRNPTFDNSLRFGPFDWQLASQPDLTASIEPADNGQNGLVMTILAGNGAKGTVASQALLLPPGRFLVTAVGRGFPSEPSDFATLSVRCLNRNGDLGSAQFVSRGGSDAVASTTEIAVPAGCDAQLLEIVVRAPFDRSGNADLPVIEQVDIDRI